MMTLKLLLVFSIVLAADPLLSIKSVSAFNLLNLPSLSVLPTIIPIGTPSISCVIGGSSMCNSWCQFQNKISTGRCVNLPGMRSKECECLDQDNVNQDYSLRWNHIRLNNLGFFSGYTGLVGWLKLIFNPNNIGHNHRIRIDSPTLLGLITALRPHNRWDFEFCRKLLYGLSWGRNVPSNKIDEQAQELFNNLDGKSKEEQLNLLSKIIIELYGKIPLSYNPTYIQTLLNSLLPEKKSEASLNSDEMPLSNDTNGKDTTKSLSQYGVPKDSLQNLWSEEKSSGRSFPERTINFIKRIFLRVFPRQPIQSEIPLNRENVKILMNIFTFQPDFSIPDSKLDNVIENLKTKLKVNVSSLPLTENGINSFLQTISNDKVNSVYDFETSTNMTKSELSSNSNEKPLITRSSGDWIYNPSEDHFPRDRRIRLNVIPAGKKNKNISLNVSDRDHENNNSNTKFNFKISHPKDSDVQKIILLTAQDLEPNENEGKSVNINKVDKLTPTVSLKDIPVNTLPIKTSNAKLSVGLKRNDDMDVTPAHPDLKKINTTVRINPVELDYSSPSRIHAFKEIPPIKVDGFNHLESKPVDAKSVEHGELNPKPRDASKSRNFDLLIDDLDQSPKSLSIPSQSPSSKKDVDLKYVNVNKLDGHKQNGPTKRVQNRNQTNKLRNVTKELKREPSSGIENQKDKVSTGSRTDKIHEPVVDGERKSSKMDVEKKEIDPKDSDVSKTRLNIHIKTVGDAGKPENEQDVTSPRKTLQDESEDVLVEGKDTKPNKIINLNIVNKDQTDEDVANVSSKSEDIKSNKKVHLQPTDKADKNRNNQKVIEEPEDQENDDSSELIDLKLNKKPALKSPENEIFNKKPSSVNNESSSSKTSSENNEGSSSKTTSGNNEGSSSKTTSGKNEGSSSKTTSGNNENSSTKTISGNNESSSSKTSSGNNESSSSKTSSGNNENSSTKTISGNNESSSSKTSSGNNESSSSKTSSGNKEASRSKTHETTLKKGKVDHPHGKKSPSVDPPRKHLSPMLPTPPMQPKPVGTTNDGSVAYFISDEDEDEYEYEEEEEEEEEEDEVEKKA